MSDRVIPIALPQVAWEQYLSEIRDMCGRSPASGVDACTSNLSNFAKYTASLAEFQAGKEMDAKPALRRPGPWLQHTFFSFLILTSNANVLRVSESTNLDVISAKAGKQRAAVVSGNLSQWREAVILFCNRESPERLRRMFNEIEYRFEQLGLADLWNDYRRDNLSDSTFYLTYDP